MYSQNNDASLKELCASELLQQFSLRNITCKQYALRVIQRRQVFKDHNLYNYFDEKEFLRQAEESDRRYEQGEARPLEGLPVCFKDNIDIEGEPNTGGTPAFWNRLPKRTSTLAHILIHNGIIRAGRTALHELALGITSNNNFTGPPRNPHNKEYSCGGSSGGSGAVVAADICPVAIGTDTAGSIRIPASYSGVIGYKPTIGRWPADYGIKLTHLCDTIGPMVRNADDLALLDSVVTNEESLKPPPPNEVKIAVPRKYFWDDLDPEIEENAEMFLQNLRDAGFQVLDNNIDDIENLGKRTDKFPVIFEAFKRINEYILQNQYDDLTVEKVIEQIQSPDVAMALQEGYRQPVSPDWWENFVLNKRRHLMRNFDDYFKNTKADVVVFPTTKVPAQKLGIDSKIQHIGKEQNLTLLTTANTYIGSVINYPGITMPLGRTKKSGIPFGIEIDTYTYNDRMLIAVSRSIQNNIIRK